MHHNTTSADQLEVNSFEMEEAASSSSSPSSAAAASKQAFAMLQPLCSRLLELPLRRGQSDSDMSLFVSLRQALCDCSLHGLRLCAEYVLFPLQLLLDASVACRHSMEAKPSQPVLHSDCGVSQNLYISDKISEGVLSCLEELLLRCPLTTTSQMSVLLRKLTAAAMLLPQEASEEFRHGAVKSLKILFSGLKSCRRSSCGCKLSALPHRIIPNEGCLKADIVSSLSFSSRHRSERKDGEDIENSCEECLIDFLQSENMAASVGHLLSLFLQISENEASMGRIGSANLRIDSILTLRILLLKVGTADTLAFFLPGVASRLVKSLQSSKQMNTGLSELSYPSGAAGSSGAAEQAVRALSELLVLVLADERNRDTLELSLRSADSGASSNLEGNDSNAEAALATLRKGSYASDKNNGKQTKRTDSSETDGQSAAVQSNDNNISQSSSVNNGGLDNFRVDRNKAWLEYTTKKISSLLALCFPALCRHPAPSIRLAITESIVILISTCRLTLEGFMPTLLESLLAMSCDDWPHVASAAHACLMSLMTEQHESNGILRDLKSRLRQIICRLLERLPKAMFSGDESVGLFLCRQLLAAMFFAGPDGVSECIFRSSAATTQFVTVMVQCLSFNVTFAGPLRQLDLTDRSSLGYISGIVELGADNVAQTECNKSLTGDITNTSSKISSSGDGQLPTITALGNSESQQLPRLPPWFRISGGCKFYPEVAGILRLVGLSSMFGSGDARNILGLIEELVAPLRCTPVSIQGEVYSDQFHFGDGQWQRRAATLIAVLNEVFYGASGLWVHACCLPFEGIYRFKNKVSIKKVNQEDAGGAEDFGGPSGWHPWEDLAKGLTPENLGDCVGDVLHEYSSDAIWKLPVHATLGTFNAPLPAHALILKDNSFLQQVIIEGIGVLALSVGKLFEEQGFLGSVLYLLLERLGCADYAVSSTADLVLHVVSSSCAYSSVRALIVASTDYIVDSLCRQLRHIDLFPNAPNMLVAVLRYTGAGRDLVPLLQEPMRSISLELEIPARQGHPGNTLPMLRALSEIVKSAKSESMCMWEKTSLGKESESGEQSDDNITMNHWEKITSSLKESERIRQSLQDIVISCLNSSSPVMASKDQYKCLLALEIVEVGVAALAYLDAVAKHEKEKRAEARNLVDGVDDILDSNEAEPPKLLPTMHRVWPHLAACLKHTAPSVLVQSSKVVSSVVASCGGDFFTRRFQKDVVPRFLTILCEGTGLQLKSEINESSDRRLLPNCQGNRVNTFKEFAPASLLKVQEAVLACINDVGKVKKSAAALVTSLEQLAAVVVGLACGVPVLQDNATQTLLSLSNIDADLVWILVADVAYGGSLQSKELASPGPMFPKASQLLPPLLGSHQEALWKQLSGRDVTFNVTSSRAWTILSKLESCRSSGIN